MAALFSGPDCAGPHFPFGEMLAGFTLIFGGAYMIGLASWIGG